MDPGPQGTSPAPSQTAAAAGAGSTSWLDEEPDFAAAGHEIKRVFRRARARPVVTLLLASLAAFLVVSLTARRVQLHRARVVLRYAQRALAEATPLMARGELQNHVYSVVLARDKLLALVHKHGLYPDELAIGEDQALHAFRRDIEVSEYRNYFLLGENIPATARVAISYTSPDRDVASAVVLDLAQTVVDYEAQHRRAAARGEVQLAKEAVDETTADLDAKVEEEREAEARANESSGVEAAQLRVQVWQLTSAVRAQRVLLEQAQGRLEKARLAAGAEDRALALGVEIARVVLPPRPRASRRPFLILMGALGFVLALPLCAIFIGAMDPRVHDLEDVERIGVPSLGRVPGFSGSDDGALADRMGTAGRKGWRGLFARLLPIRASRR